MSIRSEINNIKNPRLKNKLDKVSKHFETSNYATRFGIIEKCKKTITNHFSKQSALKLFLNIITFGLYAIFFYLTVLRQKKHHMRPLDAPLSCLKEPKYHAEKINSRFDDLKAQTKPYTAAQIEERVVRLANNDPMLTQQEQRSLNLSGNYIDDQTASTIACMLRTNTTLVALFLPYTQLTNIGALTIINALADNQHLKTLYLDHNYLSHQALKEISNLLVTNTTLQSVDISHSYSQNMSLEQANAWLDSFEHLHAEPGTTSVCRLNIMGNIFRMILTRLKRIRWFKQHLTYPSHVCSSPTTNTITKTMMK